MYSPFLIGHNALNGRPVYLKPNDMKAHGLFVGGTRRGKSKVLENTSLYLLRSKLPHIVLDPAGDTVRDIMSHATYYRLDNRIIYIDVNQALNTAVFPLNFLEPMGLDSATHASHIMKAIAKVFREENAETKPRLERRERAALMALIEAGFTLAEMMEFLSINDNRFRKHVLKKVKDRYVLNEWSEYDSISRRADKETLLESVLNRAAKIILNEPVRRCLGAPTCGLDWPDVIRSGKTVLVNLQPKVVSRECMQLIGTLIIDHLVRYGIQQDKPRTNPFFLLCDELDELATPDLGYAMQALAKRNIFVWGFIQYLEQLRDRQDSSRLYYSMMANCDLKVAFHTSYEDAKLLVRELFAGAFRGDVVKHEIEHTIQIPVETIRTVLTKTESALETDSESHSTGSSASSAVLDSTSRGTAHTDLHSIGTGIDEPLYGTTESMIAGDSSGTINGSASSVGDAVGKASTRGKSVSESAIPFYKYLERQELSSKAYFSVDELVEKYIAFIQCQPQRHAQLKLGDRKTIPLLTAFIDTPHVRKKDIAVLIERSNKVYCLSPSEIKKIIEGRQRIVPNDKSSDDYEDDNDRWQ